MYFGCSDFKNEVFGLARVRIGEVRTSEGVLYYYVKLFKHISLVVKTQVIFNGGRTFKPRYCFFLSEPQFFTCDNAHPSLAVRASNDSFA